MKKFLLSIVLSMLSFTGSFAQTIITADQFNLSGSKTISGYTVDLQKNSGTVAPTYPANTGAIRLYAKGSLTVSGDEISKIVITLASDAAYRYTTFTPSVGELNPAQAAGDTEITWEGNASSVTFTVGDLATMGTDGESKAGQIRFTSISVYGEGSDDATPNTNPINTEGHGTEANPYTVLDVIALNNPGDSAWVKGYVVGDINNNYEVELAAPFSAKTNIYLADSKNETDTTKMIPVQLVSGSDVRNVLNLVDYPDNLGQNVAVYGSLEKYWGVCGVKRVSGYTFIDEDNSQNQGIKSGVYYFATTRQTGFGTFLSVSDSGNLMRTDNTEKNSRWIVSANEDGSYYIKNNDLELYLCGNKLYSTQRKVYLFPNETGGDNWFGISSINDADSQAFLNVYTYKNDVTSYSNDDGSAWIFAKTLDDINLPQLIDGVKYTPINDEECIVSGYDNSLSYQLEIPNQIVCKSKTYKVKQIGPAAFSTNKTIQSVRVPEGMKFIDYCCFEQCSNLTTVYLPATLELIGPCAFYCSGIEDVTCMATIPPIRATFPSQTTPLIFFGSPISTGVLRVPVEYVEKYKNAAEWKNFGTIISADNGSIAATALEFEGIIGNVGERVAIGAKVLPADATDPTISWQSSNPEVAAVDQDGSVWFNAAGSATVTAECQGYEFSVPFVVKEVAANALNVFPVEAVGGVGHEFSLLALHEPENTTDKSVTWESSDPEVATVSEDGRVSLAALGSAQITARSGEHSAVCAVTVDETVGLTEMASTGVVIDVVEGGIVVRNAPEGESIAVYAVDGKVVNGAVVDGEETKLNLAAGIYIVKVSPATVGKVLIK